MPLKSVKAKGAGKRRQHVGAIPAAEALILTVVRTHRDTKYSPSIITSKGGGGEARLVNSCVNGGIKSIVSHGPHTQELLFYTNDPVGVDKTLVHRFFKKILSPKQRTRAKELIRPAFAESLPAAI